jgi:hypothetical protein
MQNWDWDSSSDFQYVKPLLDSVTEVEFKKTGQSATAQVWSVKDMTNYLQSEIDLKNDR